MAAEVRAAVGTRLLATAAFVEQNQSENNAPNIEYYIYSGTPRGLLETRGNASHLSAIKHGAREVK